MDRFSDITLFIGLIYLYDEARHRTDYVIITSLAMMFSVMTSYTRARAESIIEKCKVGFMERPERIVLFMIGAFTNRMAAVMWVILVLSIVTVADRIYFTWRETRDGVKESKKPLRGCKRVSGGRSSGPTSARPGSTTCWVIAILAFVWLTPPAWIGDPIAARPRHDRLDPRTLTPARPSPGGMAVEPQLDRPGVLSCLGLPSCLSVSVSSRVVPLVLEPQVQSGVVEVDGVAADAGRAGGGGPRRTVRRGTDSRPALRPLARGEQQHGPPALRASVMAAIARVADEPAVAPDAVAVEPALDPRPTAARCRRSRRTSCRRRTPARRRPDGAARL